MLPGLEDQSYRVEQARTLFLGVLIDVYKIMRGINRVDAQSFTKSRGIKNQRTQV